VRYSLQAYTIRSACVSHEFSLAEARSVLGNLFLPRPWIYWTDFLLTYAAGVWCFHTIRGASLLQPQPEFDFTWPKVFYFAAGCLLFYRASLFIHELVHQRGCARLKWFRFVWNLACGIPFLMPAFVYDSHIDHHRRKHYGTEHDGEYLPLRHRSRWYVLFFLSWSLVIPLVALVRFLVLTPLAWLIPGFRRLVHQHASSLVMDPSYIRPLPTPRALRAIYWQEAGCFAWCVLIAVVGPVLVGKWPTPLLIQVYLFGVVIVLLNSLRTLGSHRWENAGGEMTFVDQLLDSVNYPHRAWLTELWGPVGTRYHALHHLFPSLPYHALPEAHRRLMGKLPADSPYHRTEALSLTSVLRQLWAWARNRPAAADVPRHRD